SWVLPREAQVGVSRDGKLLGFEEAQIQQLRFPVRILDTKTGKYRTTLAGHRGTFGGVIHVAFSPDSKHAATSSMDKTVKVWEVATGKELATLRGHTNWIIQSSFSPDGGTLATAGMDGTVRLWTGPRKEAPAEQPR